MSNKFSRTEMLLGKVNMEKLKIAHVAIFGIGGVGGYVLEALARSGVGHFTLFDCDTIDETNINRQIIATTDTIGMKKTDAAKKRVLSINPNALVDVFDVFYLPENADDFPLSNFDYVIDAVDTVSAKLELATRCEKENIPIISSMGTGNKINPNNFKISDIYKTSGCPLARAMRSELRKRGVKSLKTIYSDEAPIKPFGLKEPINSHQKKLPPGSTSFVPSVAGLIIASEVVKDLCGI